MASQETNEQAFRIILLVGVFIVVPVLRYHRIRARASGDKLNRRCEGSFILLTLRPFAAAAFLALLLYVVDPRLMSWSTVVLPLWIRWAGVGGAAASAILLFFSLFSLGTNLTDTVVTRASHSLITSGPYRWVRHPFYAAFALGLASNAVVTANWFLAITGLCAVALVIARTKIEEQKLTERFGDEYLQYMRRTPRFIPIWFGTSRPGNQRRMPLAQEPALVEPQI
jgi:protein-S-isoprenylcysteine O-methyltransferase Ste14